MDDSLAQRFHALDAGAIFALRGEVEGQRLDCKTVLDANLNRELRKVFAIAVSGFANAEGGIILWGLVAAKNDEGIDCINDFPGVQNAELFLSRLNVLTPDAVSPGVPGIVHKIIADEVGGRKFVVTLIPESDSGPHMAKLGENRYYMRVGHAMMPMEHHQIADMFGRRPQPSMTLEIGQNAGLAYILTANLVNNGRGIAVAPYLLFNVRPQYVVSPYPQSGNPADFPLPRTKPGAQLGVEGFVGGMNNLIHPGLHLSFRALQIPNHYQGVPPSHCIAEFRYGAVGVPETRGRLTYDFAREIFEVLEGANELPK